MSIIFSCKNRGKWNTKKNLSTVYRSLWHKYAPFNLIYIFSFTLIRISDSNFSALFCKNIYKHSSNSVRRSSAHDSITNRKFYDIFMFLSVLRHEHCFLLVVAFCVCIYQMDVLSKHGLFLDLCRKSITIHFFCIVTFSFYWIATFVQ